LSFRIPLLASCPASASACNCLSNELLPTAQVAVPMVPALVLVFLVLLLTSPCLGDNKAELV
jgi:hypothetical protein